MQDIETHTLETICKMCLCRCPWTEL